VNLVVVSNRVARGKPNEPMTGGLAAGLLPVVEKTGAIWVGSSGRVRDGNQKEPFAEIESLGAGALAMLDLPAAHYGGYYEGFANSALWPALHSRADLIRASQDDYVSYREVNAFMARALLRFRKPDSAFWIQDYHFLALGAELRDLGVTQPIGFFLHTPWPTRAVISGVPSASANETTKESGESARRERPRGSFSVFISFFPSTNAHGPLCGQSLYGVSRSFVWTVSCRLPCPTCETCLRSNPCLLVYA